MKSACYYNVCILLCIPCICFYNVDPVVKDQTSVGNLATVAVLPISRDVQITSFTLELQHALQVIGKLPNGEKSFFFQNSYSTPHLLKRYIIYSYGMYMCFIFLGSTMRLTSDIVKENLGSAALDR